MHASLMTCLHSYSIVESPTICLHFPHNLPESPTWFDRMIHTMPKSSIICQHLNTTESLTLCLHPSPHTSPRMTCLHPPCLGWIPHDMLGLNIPCLHPHIPHMTCLQPSHDLFASPTWLACIPHMTCLQPPHDLPATPTWLACIPHIMPASPTLGLHPPHYAYLPHNLLASLHYAHISHMTCLTPYCAYIPHIMHVSPTSFACMPHIMLASPILCLHPPYDLPTCPTLCLHPPYYACITHMSCLHPPHVLSASLNRCLHPHYMPAYSNWYLHPLGNAYITQNMLASPINALIHQNFLAFAKLAYIPQDMPAVHLHFP